MCSKVGLWKWSLHLSCRLSQGGKRNCACKMDAYYGVPKLQSLQPCMHRSWTNSMKHIWKSPGWRILHDSMSCGQVWTWILRRKWRHAVHASCQETTHNQQCFTHGNGHSDPWLGFMLTMQGHSWGRCSLCWLMHTPNGWDPHGFHLPQLRWRLTGWELLLLQWVYQKCW